MRLSKNTGRRPGTAVNNPLYITAAILLVGWVIGYLVYTAAGIIHILLIMSVIAVILGIIRENKLF